MGRHGSAVTITEFLGALASQATQSKGVPEPVARYAADATMRALGCSWSEHAAPRRCAAYFWAVVRRRIVAAGGPSLASARYVLAAVVDDLSDSGRDAADIWREIEHGWRHRIPAEVIEEYRVRLCA